MFIDIGSDLGFDPLTSEVGGKCVTHYTTEPSAKHLEALVYVDRRDMANFLH